MRLFGKVLHSLSHTFKEEGFGGGLVAVTIGESDQFLGLGNGYGCE